jgi:hypothetical protein
MKKPGKKYIERVKMLLEAIEIADKAFQESITLDDNTKSMVLHGHNEMKKLALNPPEGFATIRSLAYLEDAFLTHWNEASGPDVEKFWNEISKRSINYKRREVLKEILKKKKISNDMELAVVIDTMLVAQQTGKITISETELLNEYILKFEERQAKKLR